MAEYANLRGVRALYGGGGQAAEVVLGARDRGRGVGGGEEQIPGPDCGDPQGGGLEQARLWRVAQGKRAPAFIALLEPGDHLRDNFHLSPPSAIFFRTPFNC